MNHDLPDNLVPTRSHWYAPMVFAIGAVALTIAGIFAVGVWLVLT